MSPGSLERDTGVTVTTNDGWRTHLGLSRDSIQIHISKVNTTKLKRTRRSITRMLSKCSRNYLRMLMGLQMQIESFRTKRTNVMIVGAKKVVIILTKKLLKLI